MEDSNEALYVNFETSVKFIRIVDRLLMPCNLRIRAEIIPDDEASESELQSTLSKIRFWLDQLVQKCIAISYDNTDAFEMIVTPEGMNRTTNTIMLCPGDPSDEMLAALFQAKFTALSTGYLDFSYVEIKSDNPLGLSFTFAGDARSILPGMEDWFPGRNWFNKPWWERNDASTLDITPTEDADVREVPGWAFSLDVKEPEPARTATVIRREFKPTVIDGGKKGE